MPRHVSTACICLLLAAQGAPAMANSHVVTLPAPPSQQLGGSGAFASSGRTPRSASSRSTLNRRQLECLQQEIAKHLGRLSRDSDTIPVSLLNRCYSNDMAR